MRIQRQGAMSVLEQYQRFAYSLARQRAVRGAAESTEVARIAALLGRGASKQTGQRLHAQYAAYGILQTRLRDLPGAHLRQRISVQILPAVRRHQHIDAGENRSCTAGLGASGNLFM